MSDKWFSVDVIIGKNFAVKASSQEEAREIALEETWGDGEVRDISGPLTEDWQIHNAKALANEVLS